MGSGSLRPGQVQLPNVKASMQQRVNSAGHSCSSSAHSKEVFSGGLALSNSWEGTSEPQNNSLVRCLRPWALLIGRLLEAAGPV